MVTYQKSMQLVSVFSILIFIPGLVYGQSLSHIDYQLDLENLEKTKQVTQIQKEPDFSIDCPEGTYYGLDNQGMQACRDIETNLIVESDAGEITDSDIKIRTDSTLPEIILNDEQTSYVEFGILGLIGIIGGFIGVSRKKIGFAIFQKRSWSRDEKELVRARQHGRCNMCYRETSRWAYDHFDGDKRNNDISNCQGLCPECKSEKMMISI
jgi:Zn finger protein HypA/HybF involved in hydrogenase expression